MTGRHVKTWQVFLKELTVAGMNKFTDSERLAMAEAISMAAPDGPRGVDCQDGCENHATPQTARAVMLMSELLERYLAVGPKNVKSQLTVAELAELRTVLSQRNGDVMIARKMYPRVWAMIDKLIN